MSTDRDRSHHFLDVTEAEVSTDVSALAESLSKAAVHADTLGLPDVKEHLDAALAHVAELVEGKDQA